MDDRVENIKELQEGGYRVDKRQSMVLNNFYSIITIIVVCLSILIYINYVIPYNEKKLALQKKKEEQRLKKEQYIQMRKKQIALSHKLNNTIKKDNNVSIPK